MRIGIDISVMQGGSAHRGMGRYTRQQIMAIINDEHDFFLFHQPFGSAPALPNSLTQRKNVQLIALDFPEAMSLIGGGFTREGEHAYTEAIQRFIQPYHLDLFHLTCFDDNAYYYTPRAWSVTPLVMTLYDLIPLQMADIFLTDSIQRASYMDALNLIRGANALISISEDARNEAISQLGVSAQKVFVAPPYASSDFRPVMPETRVPSIVRQIGGRYLYSVSSFGEHKNLKRLLQAFAAMPVQIRDEVKLVISAATEQKDLPPEFTQLIESLGISSRMVWTARLRDEDIIALYQHAEVCSHISLIEGFGLPILEAMQSETPVLTSDRGAMREVTGEAARLVNPEDINDITQGLTELLTNPALRNRLRAAGLEQAKTFNEVRLADNTHKAYASITSRRIRVAMWSPLPPARSGISDYTAELVPYLTQYVDLVLYTNEGVNSNLFAGLPVIIRTYAAYEQHRSEDVDIHIYHMGNNLQFHEDIYFQLLKQAGIVILHDLSLFSFFSTLTEHNSGLPDEVAYSEGKNVAAGLPDTLRKWGASNENMDLLKIPLIRRITESSRAIITHSEFGRELVNRYSPMILSQFIHLGTDFLEPLRLGDEAAKLRQQHGWTENQVVFGIFGGMNPIKRIHVVLDAFNGVHKTNSKARLVIVGREDDPTYINDSLQTRIRSYGLQDVVSFVGEVTLHTLTQYIRAIDVAINLRWPTAGETSAVMMRALGAGKPVIITDLPQWSYFPDSFCKRIPLGKNEVVILTQTITDLAKNRDILVTIGQEARRYVAANASFEVISQRYFDVIRTVINTSKIPAQLSVTGLNIIGDLHGTSGLNESCRGMVTALTTTNIPLAYQELVFGTAGKGIDFNEPPLGMPHPISLFHMNGSEMSEAVHKLGVESLHGRYNIGYWFYELPDLPVNWLPALQELDEIWVATEFVKNSVRRSTNIPITVIPMPITVTCDPSITRLRFGIPETPFVFLYSFSAMSSSARKNPFGLIEAFRKALESTSDSIVLVMKTHFIDEFPSLRDELLRRAEGLPIIFIKDNLSRIEMYSLINLCDCYISLHRAEGLGLGMAEAMALGKPVIGTGWSGNLDFMTEANSYLVNAVVGLVRDDQHDFQETFKAIYIPNASVWAEPDINHAAQLMLQVVRYPTEATEKGRRAAQTIHQHFNPNVIGQRMLAHLQAIDVTRGRYYKANQPNSAAHFPSRTGLEYGVNIIGDLHSDKGLGEAGRSMVKALSAVNVPIAYEEIVADMDGRTTIIPALAMGLIHDINILHMNAPFIAHLMRAGFAESLKNRFNVGYWFFELPDYPPEWGSIADGLDEIWVATRFVQEAIQKVAHTPVYVMPTPILIEEEITSNRALFNLPQDSFIFLFSFNPGSSAGRKNPFGLFNAYVRAFGTDANKPLLVLKIQFLDSFPELAIEIRRRASDLGIVLIEDNLTRHEMYTLIASCDCYISLHRSEGWGLGMAEAMTLGKPVIGTGWSGNIDFMNDGNSYLVDYHLVTVSPEHHEFQESYLRIFPPGSSVWADPDIDHAAQLMRRVVENPAEAAEKGQRAAETLRRDYNPTVLGQRMLTHLRTIDVTRGKYYEAVQPPAAASQISQQSHDLKHTSTPGASMYHLQRAFNDWNRERLRITIRGFGTVINRIPVIGLLFRTLIRVRNLGKVWGAESVLLEALVRDLENVRHQQTQALQTIESIRATTAPLIEEKLRGINTSLQQSTRDVQLLRQGHELLQNAKLETDHKLTTFADELHELLQNAKLDTNQKLTALSLTQGALDDQTRLNTSQLRLMLLEWADSLPEVAAQQQPSALEIVRWLESKQPLLAQSNQIDFTIQGKIDDQQTIGLGDYWQNRLTNIHPYVWYHFDYTDHWKTPAFFDNMRAKLLTDSLVVIVVWADETLWPQIDGFDLIDQHAPHISGRKVTVALYRKLEAQPA